MSFEHLGWNERLDRDFVPFGARGLLPARVAREERDRYQVLHPGGEDEAVVAGRLRQTAASRADLPAVGDWVALRPGSGEGPRVIESVLPRAGVFVRKVAGTVTEAQLVAANVDTVFVVAGLDEEYNARRLERYLAAAWDSGAVPVVVLNKADLAADIESTLAEARLAFPGTDVVALSAGTRAGLDGLSPWLQPGRTVALLGSSGVGKSTLVNALLGEERQATAAVRAADSRGRHTTTHRELLLLPGGGVLIDTPGMRELQLWADEGALTGTFPEIEALAAGCRFRDCRHEAEPGCAVRVGIEQGALAAERLTSWRKLQRELRWLARKQDVGLRQAETARRRVIHRSLRLHPKFRAPDRRGGTE
jgi:ribosome biogenesis GTPase